MSRATGPRLRCRSAAIALAAVVATTPARAGHPLIGSWNFPGYGCDAVQIHFAAERYWVTRGDGLTLAVDAGRYEDRWIHVDPDPTDDLIVVRFADGSAHWYSLDPADSVVRFEFEQPAHERLRRPSRVDDYPMRRCKEPSATASERDRP
ncbi:MAG: hypothetical protein AAFX58_14985 [Pseudomonadota bacterium]